MKEDPLAEMLNGVVDVDETYVGGKRPGKRGRGAEGKTPVVAMVQRDGRSKAFKVKHVTAKNLKSAIRANVDRRAAIMTDEFAAYRGLNEEYASHETVNHGRKEYARGNVYTNTAKGWFALLKRGVTGAFHHVSEKHLDRYLDEFTFRYDRCKITDGERTQQALSGNGRKRLMYKHLIHD
jgi:transposase-like protein